jgi:molybdopterin/thiamine biosynthesis adenylyltransferase
MSQPERVILRPDNARDRERIAQLAGDSNIQVIDRLKEQKEELIQILQLESGVDSLIEKLASDAYEGVWVFYPWQACMVRLLEESHFVKVRTNRNHNKITASEQQQLASKRIGIIGMSVGRAVATTLALERTCGSMRIADFDQLDLSNLNRLKAPLWDLGVEKTLSVQREIHSFDPFIDVRAYSEGITARNVEAFLTEDGGIDLLVDECDSLEIKILCRRFAKSHGIPVVMETSDRGMVDVERFDLDPERPIFHGRLEHLDLERMNPKDPEMRMALLDAIVDLKNVSKRGIESLQEVGKTLLTWPQLASAVAIGGGVVADTVRRILLDEFRGSGRYYVDVHQILEV